MLSLNDSVYHQQKFTILPDSLCTQLPYNKTAFLETCSQMLGHNISTQHENKVVLAFKTAPGLIMNSFLLLEKTKQKYVAKIPKNYPAGISRSVPQWSRRVSILEQPVPSGEGFS